MPALSNIVLFVLAALGLLLIPGPSVLYITTRSVSQGRGAGLVSVAGVELAGLVHVVAATFGLSALLLASALAFNIVRYLGAAYLIYLGIRTLLKRSESQQRTLPAPRSAGHLFIQGFLVNLLNPKTALFFYAFLPQFVSPTRGSVVWQILFLGVLFVGLACCTDGSYALLSATLSGWLRRSTRFLAVQRYITGAIYIVLGLGAAMAGGDRK
jgi:threonine/homoserine/homoserine lactone efflux protein